MYKDISSSQKHGNFEGYVVDTISDNVKKWIIDKGFSVEALHFICKYNQVCVIKSIHVDEDFRGNGIGSILLNEAISEARNNGADIVILEADTSESNEFDLVGWYENYGFEIIEGARDKYPLMKKDVI